jgi:acetyl-CoA synthetase
VHEDEVVWTPTDEYLEQANVVDFMDEHGFDDVRELVEASQDDVEWFWGAVEEHLGLDWYEDYDQVLDDSDGIEWARWFVGGKTNIALNCLDRHATGDRRNKLALIWEGEDRTIRKWTYRELSEVTNRLAAALREQGVGRGDAVGVFMPMLPETVAALLAVCKVGGVFVPLFSGFGVESVETRLDDADAKVLVTADGFYRRGEEVHLKPVADEAAGRVPSLETQIVFPRLDADVPWDGSRDVWWHAALEGQPRRTDTEAMDSEDPWMVIYTSGTTGEPKGTVHAHGGFQVKIAQEVAHQTDLQESDILWWFSDMGWIMGPWLTVGGLAQGGTIFLYPGAPDHPHPGRVWEMVERHQINSLGVSPTMIRALKEHGDEHVDRFDTSSIRILGSTGEPWNPEPYHWLFEKVGNGEAPIINLSGGTEVGACFLSPTPASEIKPCSLSHPSLGMDVAVVDDEGEPLPRGEVGELAALSPWPGMTRGLWEDPERYVETYWSRWDGKWYHGDFASVDEDGHWYLHGRSDDTINVAGKRLGPADVESAVVDTGKVVEAAAVGIPDDVKGNVVHVWAIPHPSATASEKLADELKDAVADDVGKPFRPAAIHFVDDLPRTRNGKILRRGVRNKAIGEDPGDLSALENPEALDQVERVE